MTSLRLATLGIAVVITLALRFVGYPDLSRISEAFFSGAGIASGTVATIAGFVVAVLIWWLIVHLVATRIPKGSRRAD